MTAIRDVQDDDAAGEDAGILHAANGLPLLLAGVLLLSFLSAGHAPNVVDAGLLAGLAGLAGLALWRRRELALTTPGAGALLLVALIAGSVATSWHPLLSMLIAPAALTGIAAFVAITLLDARALALWSVVVAATVHVLTAIVQRFVTWPGALNQTDALQLEPSIRSYLQLMRPIGLALSPDLFAAVCVAGAGAALALWLDASTRARALAAGAIVICVVGIALSRSAGGALALAALLVALGGLVLVGRGRKSTALLLGPLALLVPVALMALLGRGTEKLRMSASERLLNWSVGFDAWLEAPVMGVGWGRFAAAYAAHRTPDTNVTLYAHSLPVQLLTEGGLLFGGLIAALLVLTIAIVIHRRIAQGAALSQASSPRNDASKNAALATLLALLLRTTFDYDAQIGQTIAVLATLLGVVWLDAHASALVLDKDAATARVSPARAATVLVAVLFAIGVGTLAVGSARDRVLAPFARGEGPPSRAHREAVLSWVERSPLDSQTAALASRLHGRALTSCQQSCGALHLRATTFAEAAASGRSRPPPDVYVLLAQLAWMEHRHADVPIALAQALRLDPGHRRAHLARVGWARTRGNTNAPVWAAEAVRWGHDPGGV